MTVNYAPPHFVEEADTRPVQVVFEGVGKVYRPRGGQEVHALADVGFDVREGEVFGIIGRSGAGKSSLIRLVNGLERPTAGRVRVEGADVAALGEGDLTALRRRIGMIFQGFNLLASSTVEDNVALPLRLAGIGRREARRRAAEALELVGLSDKARAYPGRLSGGQKQRAGIARALVQKPKLLLSDEATSALDPETTRSILALLRDINAKLGLTIILITHEMEVIRDIADRVAVIEGGRIVEIGPIWRVFGNPQHGVTRSLLDHGAPALPPGIAAGDDLVFSIGVTGEDVRGPDLFAIASALGPGARLVHGNVERLQGRPSGRLYVTLPRSVIEATALPNAAEAAFARLRAVVPHAEIVSHVR
ncbi:methionine ABC transporter ATP-binding protein [Methylobrevis albus]|uniref:Cell division ATP-binding protein FtsE n=1 Tax=Methylobrevis albus TaxID=2793297 RepID=A0A931I430_9HYPH|nr:methionine ABC transporter ATP-binding protein [Methylobrevis albus]MBH0238923.1 methionine ABC transporter ATP-binding protein [Methylobrevis albus]